MMKARKKLIYISHSRSRVSTMEMAKMSAPFLQSFHRFIYCGEEKKGNEMHEVPEVLRIENQAIFRYEYRINLHHVKI